MAPGSLHTHCSFLLEHSVSFFLCYYIVIQVIISDVLIFLAQRKESSQSLKQIPLFGSGLNELMTCVSP